MNEKKRNRKKQKQGKKCLSFCYAAVFRGIAWSVDIEILFRQIEFENRTGILN